MEIEGNVVTLFNPDQKIRQLKNKVTDLENIIKALTSQLSEETKRTEEQREEIRRLRGKLMSNSRYTNAAIEKRKRAQLRKAQRQAETQLSPCEGMTETSGSESISA
jgi:chromosome segregation ATPase